MKKLCLILIILLCSLTVYAGQKYNSSTNTRDFCVTVRDASGDVINDDCKDIRVYDGVLSDEGNFFLLKSAAYPYGAVSMTTTDVAISTSYSYVRKAITSDPLYTSGTLEDGNVGQTMTILITEAQDGASYRLTPTTKTGFQYIDFTYIKDSVTLLYLDDELGWVIIAENLVDVTLE